MTYRGKMVRAGHFLFSVLFFRLVVVTLCSEGHSYSGMAGVPRSPSFLSYTAASKTKCALECMQLAVCKSFSFHPGTLGCRLFSERNISLDLVDNSQEVYFSQHWPFCPAGKGYVTVPGTNKCILVGQGSVTWTQAADACGKDGGGLLTIDNADVMQKLHDFLPVGYYHVGFNDLDTEDQHLWLDKTPVDRSLFHATEPSDDMNPSFVEDCGMVEIRTSKPGLHDISCLRATQFICSLTVEM